MGESFVVPIIVLIVSIIFYIVPPNNINSFYGYRTPASRKSIEAWREANNYSAKLMIKFSLLAIVINAVALLIIKLTQQEAVIAIFTSPIVTVGLLIVSIVMTEIHLKKLFG